MFAMACEWQADFALQRLPLLKDPDGLMSATTCSAV